MSEDRTLEAVERRHVLAVLAECGGNRAAAQRVLGCCTKTLYNLLAKYAAQGHDIPPPSKRGGFVAKYATPSKE